jgi:hypothetical protein
MKHLDALGKEAENHRRESPAPYQTTRNMDNLDAPTCSLQDLKDSTRGARDAITEGFEMGIHISKLDLEKNLEDFHATSESIAMAAKWNEETISAWEKK